MRAHPILLQKKYCRIIKNFAELMNISLEASLDFFYHSVTYKLMSKGVSDMHCMSDDYLTRDLEEEYNEQFNSDK